MAKKADMSFLRTAATDVDFKALVLGVAPSKLVLVETYSEMWGPCKALEPTYYSIYIELDSCDVGFVRAPSDSVSALFSTKGDAMPHVLFFKGGKEIARVKGPQKPLVAKLAKEHAEPIAE